MLIAKLCDRLRLTILSLMLIALPLGLGGRAHWVLPALTITNAVALSLLFLESALSGRRPRIHRAWVVSGAILLLLCVQIVPGSGLVGMLSPHAATAWEQAYAAGLTELEPRMSLAPARTRMALAMLTQIALAGFLVYNTFRSRSRLLLLSASIAGAAFVNTLTALTPTVIGSPHLYSDLGISSTPLSGTYLNRNHFGFLVGLGLLQVSGLAWLIYNSGDNGTRTIHWKSLFPFLRKHLRSPMLVGLAMAAVPMTMSLVFSLSRGAAMATAVALLFFLAVLPKGQHRGRIREGTFALTAIVAVILVGSIEALLCLWGRYEALMELGNLGLAGRWNVWRETIRLIGRFPAVGIGLHAFEPVSPTVESGCFPGRISFHAHNDYLEFISEVGLPIGLLIIVLVAVAVCSLWRGLRRCKDPVCRVLGTAAFCGFVLAMVHETVEYSLRSPANGFVLVALAVLCLLAAQVGARSEQNGKTDRRKSGHTDKQEWCRRIGYTAAAIAILAGALFVYPQRIQAGLQLMQLQKHAETEESTENTGAARRTQANHCIQTTEKVLSALPNNERALYYRAIYKQIHATEISKTLEGTEPSPADYGRLVSAVLESRQAALDLCQHLPTQGYYQALYAKQLNFSAWYDKTVPIHHIIQAFSTAHTNYPNVPQVTRLCIQAFAEILEVDRDELTTEEMRNLKRLFTTMGRSFLEQRPASAAEVFPDLFRALPDIPSLIALTPLRLLCYEPLFEFLFLGGNYEYCDMVLQTMRSINGQRLTRDDGDKIGLYDFVRTHPATEEEMALTIMRKQLALSSVTGDWAKYRQLRKQIRDRQTSIGQASLETARQAAAKGDILKARRIARTLLKRFPENSECRANMAEWCLTLGDYQEALANLNTFMWLDNAPPATLRHVLATTRGLPDTPSFKTQKMLLNDILTIRLANIGAHSANDVFNQSRTRLEQYATDAQRLNGKLSDGYLALFHAGLAAELNDIPEQALLFYAKTLEACPFHRGAIKRILALPPHIAGHRQDLLHAELTARQLTETNLDNDLIVIAPGVLVRAIRITPQTIAPFAAIELVCTIEITEDVFSIPPVKLVFVAPDGSTFSWVPTPTKRNWGETPESLKPGRLITVTDRATPALLALRADQALSKGPLAVKIHGKGRDDGYALYLPNLLVRQEAETQGTTKNNHGY